MKLSEAVEKVKDYHAGRSGSFFNHLIAAMFSADVDNMNLLDNSFPALVKAVKIYRDGPQSLYEEHYE